MIRDVGCDLGDTPCVARGTERRILDFNVTTSPSARWTAQQVCEAFPYDTEPRYLLRDRDGIFGTDFVRRVESWVQVCLGPARCPSRTDTGSRQPLNPSAGRS